MTWDEKEGKLIDVLRQSRDTLKSKLKDDWTVSKPLKKKIPLILYRLLKSIIPIFRQRHDLCTKRLYG